MFIFALFAVSHMNALAFCQTAHDLGAPKELRDYFDPNFLAPEPFDNNKCIGTLIEKLNAGCQFRMDRSRSKRLIDIQTRWYGGNWNAAQEPSLYNLSRSSVIGDATVTRLTILPSFTPASIYRITDFGDGKAQFTSKHLIGAAGYEPIGIEDTNTRALSTEEGAAYFETIDTEFLQSIPDDCHNLGNDGTTVLFEYATKDDYRMVSCWQPSSRTAPELTKIIQLITSLPESD